MPSLRGDLGRALWENRANLDYAWRVLRRGACDACALSSNGLADWSHPGLHRCPERLARLRQATQPALDLRALADVGHLAALAPDELQRLGRLPCPLLRRAGEPGFRPVDWNEALDLVAARARAADPERVCLRVAPQGLTNEARYLAQKVARFLGSPHVLASTDLGPGVAALEACLGVAGPTLPCADWLRTDLLVRVGGRASPPPPIVERARAAGVTWLPLGVNVPCGDTPAAELALLRATAAALIEKDGVARSFVDAHTEGYEALAAELEALDFDALVAQSGATRAAVFDFAAALCRAQDAVFLWDLGDCDPATTQAICDLALLRGFLGRPGSGLAPLSAPGAWACVELGCAPDRLPGGPLTAERAATLGARYGFPVPASPGHTPAGLLAAASAGRVDVLYRVGAGAGAPTADEAAALSQVGLHVLQGLTLDRAALAAPQDAVLLLPARTRHEAGGCDTTAERRLQRCPRVAGRALPGARSDWQILRDVAQRACPERAQQFDVPHAQAIREELAEVVPGYAGLERLRHPEVLWVGGERLCEGGVCPTPSGRARLGGAPPS